MAQANRTSRRGLRSLFAGAPGSGGKWACLGVLALLGVIALAWVLIPSFDGGVVIDRGGQGAASSPETAASCGSAASAETVTARVVVHVDGAVKKPGVYELDLPDGARIADVVDAAGGLSKDADTTSLNLAACVEDAMKVHVPAKGEAVGHGQPGAPQTATVTSPSGVSTGLININTATSEQLDELPGVGEATASAIVRDREANGPYKSPEDLMRVSGIGEKKFEKMKDRICV